MIKSRLQKDIELEKTLSEILQSLQKSYKESSDTIQAYLLELSKEEINRGNFVAHLFGIRERAQYDENNKSVRFEYGGSVEVPIAVNLDSWKDSSQLTLTRGESLQ